MQIPKKWKITKEIAKLNTEIEVLIESFQDMKIPFQLEKNILSKSILHSSLYSARIENNPLVLEEIDDTSEDIKQIEIRNLQKAYREIFLSPKKLELNLQNLFSLHEIICHELSPDSGRVRQEQSAIYDEFGTVVYLPPPPLLAKKLIAELFSYLISPKDDDFLLCKAFLGHYHLEKIHPFIDGNGRMGRLLISWVILAKNPKLSRAVTFVFEEYLAKEKESYYYFLEKGEVAIEDYLLFMLRGMHKQLLIAKAELEKLLQGDAPLLPHRQSELLALIKDHGQMSFDQIARRFLRVPARTLRYDLAILVKKKLIMKIGVTRGTIYEFINKD